MAKISWIISGLILVSTASFAVTPEQVDAWVQKAAELDRKLQNNVQGNLLYCGEGKYTPIKDFERIRLSSDGKRIEEPDLDDRELDPGLMMSSYIDIFKEFELQGNSFTNINSQKLANMLNPERMWVGRAAQTLFRALDLDPQDLISCPGRIDEITWGINRPAAKEGPSTNKDSVKLGQEYLGLVKNVYLANKSEFRSAKERYLAKLDPAENNYYLILAQIQNPGEEVHYNLTIGFCKGALPRDYLSTSESDIGNPIKLDDYNGTIEDLYLHYRYRTGRLDREGQPAVQTLYFNAFPASLGMNYLMRQFNQDADFKKFQGQSLAKLMALDEKQEAEQNRAAMSEEEYANYQANKAQREQIWAAELLGISPATPVEELDPAQAALLAKKVHEQKLNYMNEDYWRYIFTSFRLKDPLLTDGQDERAAYFDTVAAQQSLVRQELADYVGKLSAAAEEYLYNFWSVKDRNAVRPSVIFYE